MTDDLINDVPAPGAETSTPATPEAPKNGAEADLLDIQPKNGAKSPADGDVLAGADVTDQKSVPAEYSFAPPEGLNVAIDEEKLGVFKTKAGELGLSQGQFQSLLEYDLERSQAANEEAVGEWNDRVGGWRESAKVDKEIGGDKLQTVVKSVTSLVSEYGDAEMISMLKSPSAENPDGLAIGNNPAFLRMMSRIARVMTDSLPPVKGEGVEQANAARQKLANMYPTMFDKQ